MLSQTRERNRIKAVLIELSLILIGLGLYELFPFFQFYFSGWKNFGISKSSFWVENGLYFLAIAYLFVIPVMIQRYDKVDKKTKSFIVFEKLVQRKFDKEFWFCIRVFILKFIYIPLMCLGAIYYGEVLVSVVLKIKEIETASWNVIQWINEYLFQCFIYLAMTVVLIVYAFGYCVESEFLNNRIKSVDDNLFSWIVTLICYWPLYPLVFYVIPMGAQDIAFYKNVEITTVVRIFIMLTISIKVWSVLTLGSRSSNLTNRGIVTYGPYKWVRHPHYLTKLIVMWIGVVPSMIQNYWLIGGMIFWTTIYVLRALTEEQHLKRDTDYSNYMKKVKWRFIPGIY